MPHFPTWFWFLAAWTWIGGCIVSAAIAETKGRNSPGLALLSLVVGPLLVWAYLVAVPTAETKPEKQYEFTRP
jgi:hypothetical protein